MPKRMTSFPIEEENDTNLSIVAKKMRLSKAWVINTALEIYLNNKLGINAAKRGK